MCTKTLSWEDWKTKKCPHCGKIGWTEITYMTQTVMSCDHCGTQYCEDCGELISKRLKQEQREISRYPDNPTRR